MDSAPLCYYFHTQKVAFNKSSFCSKFGQCSLKAPAFLKASQNNLLQRGSQTARAYECGFVLYSSEKESEITSAASWANLLDVKENSRKWNSDWKTICQDKEDTVEYNPSKLENQVSIVGKAMGKCVCWFTAVWQ